MSSAALDETPGPWARSFGYDNTSAGDDALNNEILQSHISELRCHSKDRTRVTKSGDPVLQSAARRGLG